MDKIKALDIIFSSANIYDNQLNRKNLLIIFGNRNKKDSSVFNVSSIQTRASNENFHHLTGVDLNSNLNRNSFFVNALNGTLDIDKFDVGNLSELKLEVLENALKPFNFRMFGKYDGNRPDLNTDYLVGGEKRSLGFTKIGNTNFYVPNTVLNGDIRQDIEIGDRRQVFAVLKKDITAPEYQKVLYIAKNVFLHELFEKIQKQNPDIHINVNYETELTKPQLAKEKEFMQKAEIAELAGKLNQLRNDYLNDSENMDLLEQYDTAQKNFALKAKEYNMYDYAESLLNQQKAVSKNSKVREYIDSDVQALKKECGLTLRSTEIFTNVHAASPEIKHDTVAVPKKETFALLLPPEHPFKALWVKAKEIVRNIADSFHKTEKPPDKPEQTEKSELTDNTEKSEEDELIVLDVYNMSVKNQNGYIEFINTSKAMDGI